MSTKNAELIFRKIALDVPGVISVIGLNTNTSNGRTTVALTAEVQDGDYISSTVTTNISGQLIGE
jgi:acyl CoA:acetate/3-ketoacid CoA transferase